MTSVETRSGKHPRQQQLAKGKRNRKAVEELAKVANDYCSPTLKSGNNNDERGNKSRNSWKFLGRRH